MQRTVFLTTYHTHTHTNTFQRTNSNTGRCLWQFCRVRSHSSEWQRMPMSCFSFCTYMCPRHCLSFLELLEAVYSRACWPEKKHVQTVLEKWQVPATALVAAAVNLKDSAVLRFTKVLPRSQFQERGPLIIALLLGETCFFSYQAGPPEGVHFGSRFRLKLSVWAKRKARGTHHCTFNAAWRKRLKYSGLAYPKQFIRYFDILSSKDTWIVFQMF